MRARRDLRLPQLRRSPGRVLGALYLRRGGVGQTPEPLGAGLAALFDACGEESVHLVGLEIRGRHRRKVSHPEGLRQRRPEEAHVGVAIDHLHRQRPLEDRLDRIADLEPEVSRRRSPVRVLAGEGELEESVPPERRLPAAHHVEVDQRHPEDVRPGAGRPVNPVELLGRAVVRGKGGDVAPGRLHRRLGLRLHHLGDAEVEHLDHCPRRERAADDEEVLGLDVAVRDAMAVGQGQRPSGSVEELEHRRGRTLDPEGLGVLLDQRLQGVAFEPLQHHVGQPHASGRGQRADVSRLDDRRRTAGENAEELALLDEEIEELLAAMLGRVRQRGEALNRHRLVPDPVLGPVDHPEAALSDEPLDLILLRDEGADESIAILFGSHTWLLPET